MGPFHTTINTKGEKQNKMQSFLIPEKTSPDITILLCIKIMLNVFYIENAFVFFATLRHFRRYQQFSVRRLHKRFQASAETIDWESYRHLSLGGQMGQIAQLANAIALTSTLIR